MRESYTTMEKLDKHLYLKWVFGISYLILLIINWNLITHNQGLIWMNLLVVLYIIFKFQPVFDKF